MQAAADAVIQAQLHRTALPRRHSLPMREIWEMQQRLTTITGKRPLRLLGHPRFRAGYDFLILRGKTDEEAAALADWWTRFLALDEAGRAQALQPSKASPHKAKSRRRRKARSARKAPKSTPLQPEI
jgi:poly(A) polymerase